MPKLHKLLQCDDAIVFHNFIRKIIYRNIIRVKLSLFKTKFVGNENSYANDNYKGEAASVY